LEQATDARAIIVNSNLVNVCVPKYIVAYHAKHILNCKKL